MPLRSSSFSLYRTVLNAAGRAPSAPKRALRRPATTRHVAMKSCRSSANSAPVGSTVWLRVSVNGMPYCLRLLQADIFPQNESRRSAMVIFPALSGNAWTSTGTFRSAQRRTLAMARSSPKLGERDDHAGNPVAVRLEQIGALRRVVERFDAAELGVGRPERDDVGPGGAEHVDHDPAAGVAEMVGKEPAIADDEAESDGAHVILLQGRRPTAGRAVVRYHQRG